MSLMSPYHVNIPVLGLKRDFSYSMRAVIASSMFLLGIWTCFMMCVAIK